MEYNKLTKEEEYVIQHKGTERPFTGEYNANKQKINLTAIAVGQVLMMK